MKRILPFFVRRGVKGSRSQQKRRAVEEDVFSERGFTTFPTESEHHSKEPVTGDPPSNTPSLLMKKR